MGLEEAATTTGRSGQMTISSSVASLFSADYATTIQDALGNSGATATIDAKGSLTITGTPSGAGLKIRAAESAQSGKSSAKDTISLSPAAQNYLASQQIGLKLLRSMTAKPGSDAATESATTIAAIKVSPTSDGVAVQGGPGETDLSDVAALAQQDPTQVIKDTVAAADETLASISTTAGFTAAAVANPALIKGFASNLPDNLGDGFMAALKNGTMAVQTGVQAGYDTDGGISLTGMSMASLGTRASNPVPVDLTKNNQIIAGFGFGSLSFVWPK